jgi:protein-tyrosine kinase
MSRIDEALRRAAMAEGAPDRQHDGLRLEPSAAGTIDPSVLDRFAIETPAPRQTPAPRENGRYASEPVPRQSPSEAPIRVIAPALASKLVLSPDIPPMTLEQYRRLAASLHDLQAQHGLKSLMVTSAAPEEGKTLTIVNVALTLSESYHQRVLLIDTDLRRPSVHETFGIPNGAGISDVLSKGGPMPVVEISRRLHVVTAGRRLDQPLAMLTSDHAREVIAAAGAGYDWVLLDTPPVGLLPDAQLVARLTEAALFVIAAGVTPYSLVQRAISELGPERIVGTVLNRVEDRQLRSRDSYGGYYGSYGEKASAQ